MNDRRNTPARNLRLHDKDNLIVAVDGLMPGAEALGVVVAARIPRGHKMATAKIAKGEPILKFGQIIGFAGEDIEPGQHVHTHNCAYAEFDRDYAFARGRAERGDPAGRATGDVRGLQACEWQGWHAQLRRRS